MPLRMILLAIGLVCGAVAIAHAAGPTFTVRCMHTAGPKVLPKYGTYYFLLPEGQVKGYACALPGRPCKIVSQTGNTIVFQTPGDFPDTMTISLADGSIEHTTAEGEKATFACRQIPNGTD
jgi:hypothetical protein